MIDHAIAGTPLTAQFINEIRAALGLASAVAGEELWRPWNDIAAIVGLRQMTVVADFPPTAAAWNQAISFANAIQT